MGENEGSGVQNSQAPVLCAKGCGFYGSATTLNMCSKCFGEHQKNTQSHEEVTGNEVAAQARSIAASVVAARDEQHQQQQQAAAAAAAEVASSSHAAAPAAVGMQVSPASDQVLQPLPQLAPQPDSINAELEISSTAASAAASSLLEQALDRVDSNVAQAEAALAAISAAGAPGEDAPRKKIQKNAGRCFECKKKIGLTGFKCRCGYTYCGEHRYSDKHACDFDYKSLGQEQLSKANPLIVAAKLEKI